MAISNAKYDAIMRSYEERRLRNLHTAQEHKDEVYDLIPEMREIDMDIANTSVEQGKKLILQDEEGALKLKKHKQELVERKQALLEEFGFPEDYLAPIWSCSICKDTGYVDGKRCKCLVQAINRVLYEQSNLDHVLAEENFDNLSYEYYNDSDIEEMRRIVGACKDFAERFDEEYTNLLLLGDVGVGKTYLTNCIAGKLLQSGHSVIYFTAFQLFETLAKYTFHSYDADEMVRSAQEDIFSCDLLVIDDLGTEMTNTFVSSQLFRIVNERNLRKKSTVISTNLSLEDLIEKYSERTFSRIFGFYKKLRFVNDDIRVKKSRTIHRVESEV